MMAVAMPRPLWAQGFAGLGRDAEGFAQVSPGRVLAFPADHGAHPDYRIEWWYVTANLTDGTGARYGAQWTLFRQATAPNDTGEGWANRQVWMGHCAVTSATAHRFAETFSRGGVGTSGVESSPVHAWIDDWSLRGGDAFDPQRISPLAMNARGDGFAVALELTADQPLVLQGNAGYSRKSERGQASYYYSQPFYRASGHLVIGDATIEVSGQAWLDREWSSQPLASEQKGWDWLSLHLDSGDKAMLFRLRQTDGADYLSGNWIARDGSSTQLAPADIAMTPLAITKIGKRELPTSWRVQVKSRGLAIEIAPLNPQSWMATSFPYWEGPIRVSGSHAGVGYLEMTGY